MKRLLISRCLLGDACRYDGKSKPLPAETLQALRARYDLIPVCPEVLGGLPTPRTPSERRGARVVMKTGEDVTAEFGQIRRKVFTEETAQDDVAVQGHADVADRDGQMAKHVVQQGLVFRLMSRDALEELFR